MKLSLLTAYRTELMGLAMLMVVFFHSNIVVPENLFLLSFIKKTSFSGVDIFFFLSGLGLFFSISKENKTSAFLKKRLVRIIPGYFLVIICATSLVHYPVYNSAFLKDLFLRLTTLSFWLNNSIYDWYIPGSLFLYILFPFYTQAFNKTSHKLILIITICVCSLVFSIYLNTTPLVYLIIFTARIPVFFLGAYSGYLISLQYKLSRREIIIYSIIFLLFLIYLIMVVDAYYNKTTWLYNHINWLYGSWWHVYLILTPIFCVLTSSLYSFIEKKNLSFLLKPLKFTGTLSLEIYLLHIEVFKLEKLNLVFLNFDKYKIVKHCIYLIIIFISAYLLHLLLNKIALLLQKTTPALARKLRD